MDWCSHLVGSTPSLCTSSAREQSPSPEQVPRTSEYDSALQPIVLVRCLFRTLVLLSVAQPEQCPVKNACYHGLQENVTAVLTSSPTDVLSHVAIRARSQGVLLATCFDEAALSSIKQLQGKNVRLDVDATGAVTATETAATSAAGGASKQGNPPSTVSRHVIIDLPSTFLDACCS